MPDDSRFLIPKGGRKPVYPETEERSYLSDRAKLALVEKQEKRCACCKCEPTRFEFDHILALSEGGTNDPDNWQALCRGCHLVKGRDEARRRKKRHKLRGLTGQQARRERKKPWAKINRDGSLRVNRP